MAVNLIISRLNGSRTATRAIANNVRLTTRLHLLCFGLNLDLICCCCFLLPYNRWIIMHTFGACCSTVAAMLADLYGVWILSLADFLIYALQKYHVNRSDVTWPAHVEDADFLVFQDGSIQLSCITEPQSHATSVWLSSTRHIFTARFLAKIGRSLIGRSCRTAQVSTGECLAAAVSIA